MGSGAGGRGALSSGRRCAGSGTGVDRTLGVRGGCRISGDPQRNWGSRRRCSGAAEGLGAAAASRHGCLLGGVGTRAHVAAVVAGDCIVALLQRAALFADVAGGSRRSIQMGGLDGGIRMVDVRHVRQAAVEHHTNVSTRSGTENHIGVVLGRAQVRHRTARSRHVGS
jgi:hypothetical protein